jgi:hypothetical protein
MLQEVRQEKKFERRNAAAQITFGRSPQRRSVRYLTSVPAQTVLRENWRLFLFFF